MKIFQAFAMRVELPTAAERQEEGFADLSTAEDRERGTLSPYAVHLAPDRRYWTKLKGPVPGRLLKGTLPETHRARFLLRMPREWNGGLVVAASAGVTDQHCYDLYLSDFVLQKGYAFAVTDKAVRTAALDPGTVLFAHTPESSIAHWSERLDSLANLAIEESAKYYGRKPEQVIAFGVSNGGYIARRAAESQTGLFSAALDVSGVLWRADRNNLLREIPKALRASEQDPWNEDLFEESGMPDFSGQWHDLARQYRDVYWHAVMHLFLGDFDSQYSGSPELYDLDSRPDYVHDAIRAVENSGDLQVPCISLAGSRDFLISCRNHALGYSDLVKSRGKSSLHELRIIENAAHVDSNGLQFSFLTPLMPHAHEAFDRLCSIQLEQGLACI
jgi:alpha-beta hydrolase superfamily lysophospholipase